MENWRFSAAAILKEENYSCSNSWTSIGDIGRIYNGHEFITVYVTEDMVGHKLGEFAPTRTFKGHSGNDDKAGK